jgi:hypothetical protein
MTPEQATFLTLLHAACLFANCCFVWVSIGEIVGKEKGGLWHLLIAMVGIVFAMLGIFNAIPYLR